jgi:hypothetical protein
MDVLLFLVLALAAFRITRLLVADEFPPVAAVRERVTRRFGGDSSPAYLVHCPWCTGVYVSAALVAALDWLTDHTVLAPALLIAAVSAAVGYLAALDPSDA